MVSPEQGQKWEVFCLQVERNNCPQQFCCGIFYSRCSSVLSLCSWWGQLCSTEWDNIECNFWSHFHNIRCWSKSFWTSEGPTEFDKNKSEIRIHPTTKEKSSKRWSEHKSRSCSASCRQKRVITLAAKIAIVSAETAAKPESPKLSTKWRQPRDHCHIFSHLGMPTVVKAARNISEAAVSGSFQLWEVFSAHFPLQWFPMNSYCWNELFVQFAAIAHWILWCIVWLKFAFCWAFRSLFPLLGWFCSDADASPRFWTTLVLWERWTISA